MSRPVEVLPMAGMRYEKGSSSYQRVTSSVALNLTTRGFSSLMLFFISSVMAKVLPRFSSPTKKPKKSKPRYGRLKETTSPTALYFMLAPCMCARVSLLAITSLPVTVRLPKCVFGFFSVQPSTTSFMGRESGNAASAITQLVPS